MNKVRPYTYRYLATHKGLGGRGMTSSALTTKHNDMMHILKAIMCRGEETLASIYINLDMSILPVRVEDVMTWMRKVMQNLSKHCAESSTKVRTPPHTPIIIAATLLEGF